MLTIYISPRNVRLTDVTGHTATVKGTFVREGDGFKSLQDLEPSLDIADVEFVYMRPGRSCTLPLTDEVKCAVLTFLKEQHAYQDTSFDCFAFANLVKDVPKHDKRFLLAYWTLRPMWPRPRTGDVVFLLREEGWFRHAAVYLGHGLYLSVWGGGGDLEVATLSAMKRDFKAPLVRIARPQPSAIPLAAK